MSVLGRSKHEQVGSAFTLNSEDEGAGLEDCDEHDEVVNIEHLRRATCHNNEYNMRNY